MTIDRTTLENAARACGYDYTVIGQQVFKSRNDLVPWNPAYDSGQCADMEAELGIDVIWYETRVAADCNKVPGLWEKFTDHNNDRQAARRYASVRLAAKIQLAKEAQ